MRRVVVLVVLVVPLVLVKKITMMKHLGFDSPSSFSCIVDDDGGDGHCRHLMMAIDRVLLPLSW